MADEADIANDNAERHLQALLAQERQKGARQITPRQDGTCYNDCGDNALAGAAFCSKECAEDVEKRMKLAGVVGAFARAAAEVE